MAKSIIDIIPLIKLLESYMLHVIHDITKKKIDQIVGKVLRKIKDLEFTGWTNFRER